jgi:hypothetical protein
MEKTHFVLCLSIFVKQPVLWGIFFFASIYSLMILMFFFLPFIAYGLTPLVIV